MLAAFRQFRQQRFNLRQKAHVHHAVRLIDRSDRKIAPIENSFFAQLPYPARRSHQKFSAVRDGFGLGSDGRFSYRNGDRKSETLGQKLCFLGHLKRQLTGRHQHQPPQSGGPFGQGLLWLPSVQSTLGDLCFFHDALNHGHQVGESLAPTSLRNANDIFPVKCGRNRGGLNGSGLSRAGGPEVVHQNGFHPKSDEVFDNGIFSCHS